MSALPLVLIIYLLPGFCLTRIFAGKIRNEILFVLFNSFIATPIIYLLLAAFGLVTLRSFIAVNILLFLFYFFKRESLPTINADKLLPQTNIGGVLTAILLIFWLMNILPRIGLLTKHYPIGDDMHRVGKIVAVAESPTFPLFYHFPTTRLTIYYFVGVAPGLLTKFSGNAVKTNQAWFIQVSLWTLSILYFLALCAKNLFNKLSAQTFFFLCLTFFSGYEIYIAFIKGINPIMSTGWTDLEWWNDWFTHIFNIHFQISSPFTLFFWVPQHLFSGVLTIFIYLILKSGEQKKPVGQFLIGVIFTAVFGYSAFVFAASAFAFLMVKIVDLQQGRESLKETIIENYVIGLIFLLFSADLIRLYLTADKGSWFSIRLNVYWLLPSFGLINKIINLILTLPIMFAVELGGSSLVLAYSARTIIKNRVGREMIFWYFCIYPPLIAMFFFRAADDNNISLRTTIPALIGLAVIGGNLVQSHRKNDLPLLLFFLAFFLSLPTTLYSSAQRISEQFSFNKERLNPVFSMIDEKIPLNSVIFSDEPRWTDISVLAHRFTFKPPKHFNPTDKEYSAASKLSGYQFLELDNLDKNIHFSEEIRKNSPFLKDYGFYFLTTKEFPLETEIQTGGYNLYKL